MGHIGKQCNMGQKFRNFLAEYEENEAGESRNDIYNENQNDVVSGSNNNKVLDGVETFKNFSILQQAGESDIDSSSDCNKIVVSESSERFDPVEVVERSACHGPAIVGTIEPSKQLSRDIFEYRINFQCHSLIRHDIVLKGKLSDVIWSPYIDSGAQRSVISKSVADRLGLEIIRKFNFRVIGFDQKPSKLVYGYIERVELVVPGSDKILNFSLIVINDSRTNLCGLDIIVPSGAALLSMTLAEPAMCLILKIVHKLGAVF